MQSVARVFHLIFVIFVTVVHTIFADLNLSAYWGSMVNFCFT